jgi:hypothetical protein
MADRMHRTQILIEPEQHAKLTNLAREQNRSVSEIIREVVGQYLADRAEVVRWHGRLQGLERARKLRKAIREERGGKPIDLNLINELGEIRQQRDADLLLQDKDDEDRD